MTPAHVTQTGNMPIMKKWVDELGPAFKRIDEEIKRKNISFSRQEAIKDDLYD